MSSIYASSEFVGYSLWLVPDEAASKKFCHAIEECAKELGTPTFKPHATLIGGVVVRLENANGCSTVDL
jgi:hypothetical protein